MPDNFVNETIKEQESTRTDIRALKAAIDRLSAATATNSDLLHQVLAFQKAQDERDARQADIAKDVARIAHSVTKLVEGLYVQIQGLNGLIDDLRLNTSAERTMEGMIAKINAAGIAIDERGNG